MKHFIQVVSNRETGWEWVIHVSNSRLFSWFGHVRAMCKKPLMAKGAIVKWPVGARAIRTGDGLVRKRVSSSQSRAVGIPIEVQAAVMSGLMVWTVCMA